MDILKLGDNSFQMPLDMHHGMLRIMKKIAQRQKLGLTTGKVPCFRLKDSEYR